MSNNRNMPLPDRCSDRDLARLRAALGAGLPLPQDQIFAELITRLDTVGTAAPANQTLRISPRLKA